MVFRTDLEPSIISTKPKSDNRPEAANAIMSGSICSANESRLIKAAPANTAQKTSMAIPAKKRLSDSDDSYRMSDCSGSETLTVCLLLDSPSFTHGA